MQTFSLKEAFKQGWRNTEKHIEFLALSTFVFFVIYFILKQTTSGFSGLFIGLASFILGMLFNIGMRRIGLLIDSGQSPKVDNFKSSVGLFLSVLWATIIIGFFTLIGLILLIIPGIIVVLRTSMAIYLILDKKLDAWPAVKESWHLTKGFSWKLFWFFLFSGIIIIVSFIPFGLGLIISVPFLSLTHAVIYRKISNFRSQAEHLTPILEK